MEQIKVGDKVRVSKDAPKTYLRGRREAGEYKVYATDREAAIITCGWQKYVIPLKYLIKVEDEAKEPTPKYKVGEKVIMPDGDIAIITKVDYDSATSYDLLSLTREDKKYWLWREESLTPYTEPTEEKTETPLDDLVLRQPIISVADQDQEVTYEIDWTFYTAELAKEIVLKVVDICDKPEVAAEYAVSVAKTVVAGLKKGGEK